MECSRGRPSPKDTRNWFYHEKIRESSLSLSLTGDSTETQRLRFLLSHLSHLSTLAIFGCSDTSSHNSHNLLLSIRRIDLIPSYLRSVEGTSGSNLGNFSKQLLVRCQHIYLNHLVFSSPFLQFATHSIVPSISTFQFVVTLHENVSVIDTLYAHISLRFCYCAGFSLNDLKRAIRHSLAESSYQSLSAHHLKTKFFLSQLPTPNQPILHTHTVFIAVNCDPAPP